MNVPKAAAPLAIGWAVACYAPAGPYFVLVIGGEQGSAKSWTARRLFWLVDPREPDLRGQPRSTRDLIVAARHSLVVGFDNVSYLGQELSDDLARLATGTGFGSRALYTDYEEVVSPAPGPSSSTASAAR